MGLFFLVLELHHEGSAINRSSPSSLALILSFCPQKQKSRYLSGTVDPARWCHAAPQALMSSGCPTPNVASCTEGMNTTAWLLTTVLRLVCSLQSAVLQCAVLQVLWAVVFCVMFWRSCLEKVTGIYRWGGGFGRSVARNRAGMDRSLVSI